VRSSGVAYEPGIDGLRAIAVCAVILYHADVSWARGGFLGVDIFFVVSGYLITALLLAERDGSGRIDLRAFWRRRARRLLPALLLMMLVVGVWAALSARAVDLINFRAQSVSTMLYVSNWKLILDGSSYFHAFLPPSPLQHTWSLAVEEQWYLLWPVALVALDRVTKRQRGLLAGTTAALALGSAGLMAALYHSGGDPSRLYYGTDTRAQALLVGAAFAAWKSRRPRSSGSRRPADPRRGNHIALAFGVAGACTLIWLAHSANATGPFLYRGGFLVVALASLALVVAAQTTAGRTVLGIAPLRGVGMISYGLYLWHWPVDVIISTDRFHASGPVLFTVRVSVTLVAATFSYYVIERPIRRDGLRGLIVLGRRSALRFAVPALVVVTTVSLVLYATRDTPSLAAVEATNAPPFAPRRPTNAAVPRVLLLGDSQMFTLVYRSRGELDASQIALASDAIIGCGVFDASMHLGKCAGRADEWQHLVAQFDPDLSVLLIGAWEVLDFTFDGHRYVHGTPAHADALATIVRRAIAPLLARHGRVALLETPCFGESRAAEPSAALRDDRTAVANVNAALRRVANDDRTDVSFVNWAGAICPGGHYVSTIDGVDVRPDGVHYASNGGTRIALNALLPELRRLAIAAEATHRDTAR
jgi:peptidoglycan/LPS O-acetylase OafA/YrhL